MTRPPLLRRRSLLAVALAVAVVAVVVAARAFLGRAELDREVTESPSAANGASDGAGNGPALHAPIGLDIGVQRVPAALSDVAPWRVFDAATGVELPSASTRETHDPSGQHGIVAAWAEGYVLKCVRTDAALGRRIHLERAGDVRFVLSADSDLREVGVSISWTPIDAGTTVRSAATTLESASDLTALHAVITGESSDRALRAAMERALESKAAPMQSSGFEGNLPTTLRGLAPGRYVYSVSGEEHLVEPTRYEPHSRRLSDGRILSDPTAVSHRRATIPFDVRPGEVTEVELRAVLTCIVRGSLPSTGSAENSHANVHLRHEETRSGERRVDLEAALVGRFGTFELVDLRPGTKILSATVRTGDRVTWLSVPPFELLPGETRDVGELEPGGAQLTVVVNLVESDGADPREGEGRRTITLLSASPGQPFVNRAVEFDGRQGTALFDGLPKGHYTVYVDLTPPAAGRSYRDPPPYQQSVTIGGPGSSESVVFDFVETASRVAGAYVQLYSEIDPSDAESAYGGYRTSHGRGSTASLPECVPAGEGWHYLLPVHDGDVHFAAAIIERGEHGRAEYFEGFAPGVTSGAVLGPYRAVPSTSVTLALPGDATPPSALDLKPPSHERWTQLSVEVVFEKDVSGAWTSSPMSLPIDWHVRATRSAGPTWTVTPSPTPIEAAPR